MAFQDHENDIILELSPGTSCTINLHGATVLSWKADGVEQLFVSSSAVFDGKSPIRGGIPIAFPKFGPWDENPLHGFARVCKWSLKRDLYEDSRGILVAVLSLVDDAWTRSLWDFEFELTYTVALSKTYLETTLNVFNPSRTKSMMFEILLHTYLRVDDLENFTIYGLDGSKYSCSREDHSSTLDSEPVKIVGPITRFYQQTGKEHKIRSEGRYVLMSKTNFPDTVVWNPGKEAATTIDDLPDEEYNQFVCVEPGHITDQVQLEPGKSFEASQKLVAVLLV